jgi:AcrR family transcriptional regulator
MIDSAVRLQGRYGVAGTAFADVLADSGAPRGSVYHHFPGGRAELAELATARGAAGTAQRIESLLAGGDIQAALDGLVAHWVSLLSERSFHDGCAVAAGALDPAPESAARTAAAVGFRRWEDLLTAALEAHASTERARRLAVTCLAAIEGAIIFARAQGSPQPLHLVGEQLRELLEPVVSNSRRAMP